VNGSNQFRLTLERLYSIICVYDTYNKKDL
jgi:hypothetical protein